MLKTLTLLAWLAVVASQTYGDGYVHLTPTPCVNWEQNKAAYEAAKSVWSNPPCYNFSYTFLGFQVGYPTPTKVQVRNGAVSGDGDKSINSFFDMIESKCFANCPNAGAQSCIVEYTADGYPTSISIDGSEYSADEELIYSLSDFAVFNCDGSSVSASGSLDLQGQAKNQTDGVSSSSSSSSSSAAGQDEQYPSPTPVPSVQPPVESPEEDVPDQNLGSLSGSSNQNNGYPVSSDRQPGGDSQMTKDTDAVSGSSMAAELRLVTALAVIVLQILLLR